jgi:hypothetical protein
MSSDALVAALQAQVAGLKVALRQANQLVARLMGKLSEAERNELFQLIVRHMAEQDVSKSANLVAVMRTATMQLSAVALATADQRSRLMLVEVIKALTLTTEAASPGVVNEKEDNEKRTDPAR